jgi:hypothetical protein
MPAPVLRARRRAVALHPPACNKRATVPQAGGAVPLIGVQKIQPDCRPKPGFVDGPKNHVLCATHGHVMDTKAGIIIAASVKDYDAQHSVPRKMDPDCQPIPGKMPKAPKNIVLCKHGHVLDTAKGEIVANTRTMFFRAHPQFASPVSADDIPDDPSPGPGLGPGPGPGPSPQPDPSVDPPPTGHELKRVFPEKVAKLKSALDGIGTAPDDAIAAEVKMRADAKTRGIDPENTDEVDRGPIHLLDPIEHDRAAVVLKVGIEDEWDAFAQCNARQGEAVDYLVVGILLSDLLDHLGPQLVARLS